jgi:RNA polymerase sigma factor (sigma-70 family)
MADLSLQTVLHQLRRLASPKGLGALTDAQLLQRIVGDRDAAAFEVAVWRYGPMVLGVCRKLLRREQDAEDAFQATFLTLARQAHAIGKGDALAGWLYQVAYRAALRARSRDLKHRAAERLDVEVPAVTADTADLENRELFVVLAEELQRLPEKYRAPLISCYLQGKTHEQTARELRRPPGSISRHLARGRELLRGRMARRGACLSTGLLVTLLADKASAAVLPSLVLPTVTAALEYSAGAAVGTPGAALANGVIKGMFLSKMKAVAGVVLILGMLAAGTAGLAHQVLAQHPPKAEPSRPAQTAESPKPTEDKKAPLDPNGDPLPDGAVFRLGGIRLRHTQPASAVIFSANGKELLSAGKDQQIRVWDPATGKEKQRIAFEADKLWAAHFPDAKTALVCNWDGTIRILDASTGKERQTIKGKGTPSNLALSPDGKTLLTALNDGKVIAWDPATGKSVREHAGPGGAPTTGAAPAAVFTPDGAAYTVGGKNNKIILVETATGKEIQTFAHPPSSTLRRMPLAFSPDGKLLAGGGLDQSVRVWDVESGKEVHNFNLPKPTPETIQMWAQMSAHSLAFAPDGKTLAAGYSDGATYLWTLATGKNMVLEGHAGPVADLAFSPDGKMLAATDGAFSKRLADTDGSHGVRLWDVGTGKELHRPGAHVGAIQALFLSADGKRLVSSGTDGTVRMWDATNGKHLEILAEHTGPVTCLAVSPDGKAVHSMSFNGGVRLWQDGKSKVVWTGLGFGGTVTMQLSPDGKYLAWGMGTIQIRELSPDKPTRTFKGPGAPGLGFRFSPDGRLLAAAGGDRAIRVWNVASGEEVRVLPATQEGNAPASLLAFAPDGRTLASWGGALHLWETRTGYVRFKRTDLANRVTALAFSADGRLLAVADHDAKTDAALVRLLDVATGKEVGKASGHEGPVKALAFSRDGKTLASGGNDTSILLWDVAALVRAEKPAIAKRTEDELNALWNALGAWDGDKVHQAVWALAQSPEQAVPLLRERVKLRSAPDAKRVAKLIAELDDDSFTVRENASKELAGMGKEVAEALTKALETTKSVEVRNRLKELLEKTKNQNVPLETVRLHRALEVLELVGTPEALKVLQDLADKSPEDWLAKEIEVTIQRIEARR